MGGGGLGIGGEDAGGSGEVPGALSEVGVGVGVLGGEALSVSLRAVAVVEPILRRRAAGSCSAREPEPCAASRKQNSAQQRRPGDDMV